MIKWVLSAREEGTAMTHDGVLAEPVRASQCLRVGGVCAIVGAIVFATVRLVHGDIPAADAQAALDFVAARPSYPAVHVIAVFAALTELTGLVVLAGSLVRPSAWLMGRMGVISAVAGLGIFGVESTSEGLALPELAGAASGAARGAGRACRWPRRRTVRRWWRSHSCSGWRSCWSERRWCWTRTRRGWDGAVSWSAG
jgi:hypothetical protein